MPEGPVRSGATHRFAYGRTGLVLCAIFSAAAFILGAGSGTVLVTEGDMPFWMLAGGMFCAAFLGLAGATYLRYAVRGLRAVEPPIEIGPAGFHDRRLSTAPLPWAAIREVSVLQIRGPSLMLDLNENHPAAKTIRTGPALKSLINRGLGLPPFDVIRVGLKASLDDLFAAIAPYKKVKGRD